MAYTNVNMAGLLRAAIDREAKARLRWFDYYESHGHSASLTGRYFGISRTTFYR